MKSITKYKFLHIALKFSLLILQKCRQWDPKSKMRSELASLLITPNFLRVVVKNVASQKNQLHEISIEVKNELVTFLKDSALDSTD